MDTIYNNINTFFSEVLNDLPCQADTRAYIISIFSKYKKADFDLSKDSISLVYSDAILKQDFHAFQTIGDYIFFTNTVVPEFLHNASIDYYQTIGRLSYHSCYKLINKQWKLFDELSERFNPLSNRAKRLLDKANIKISHDV